MMIGGRGAIWFRGRKDSITLDVSSTFRKKKKEKEVLAPVCRVTDRRRGSPLFNVVSVGQELGFRGGSSKIPMIVRLSNR